MPLNYLSGKLYVLLISCQWITILEKSTGNNTV